MTRNNACLECGGPFNGEHPQVGVTGDYGLHAHIDAGIAPLIEVCWELGLTTSFSCEEPAYITFGPGSAERFATFATSARTGFELESQPEDALDLRIYQARDEDDPLRWRWLPGYPWTGGFTLWFPSSDIPEVTRRVQAIAEANREPT